MKDLANQIEREMQRSRRNHYAIYEDELQRYWPLDDEDREPKIAEFAKRYGFRLRFYKKGLCAIFDKSPWDYDDQRSTTLGYSFTPGITGGPL